MHQRNVRHSRTRRVAAVSLEEDRLSLAVGRARNQQLEKLDFIEETPSGGFRGGMISDAELFCGALDRLASSLERVAQGGGLDRIICGVHGPFIQIRFFTRSFKIPRGVPLTETEIDRSLYETAIRAGEGRVLLQVVPWRFVLDGYREAAWPVGLRADEMTVEALGVYADRAPYQDFQDALDELGLAGSDLVVSSLASGRYALTSEEREEGVVLLEFAWDECRVSVYCRSRLYLHRSTPNGLRSLADALALVVPMTPQEARRLLPTLSLENGNGDRLALAARDFLTDAVNAAKRYLDDSVKVMGSPPVTMGWVLSGLLAEAPGCPELIASLVTAPTRVARPPSRFQISGHEGSWATSIISLLDCAASEPGFHRVGIGRPAVSPVRSIPGRLVSRVRTALRPGPPAP